MYGLCTWFIRLVLVHETQVCFVLNNLQIMKLNVHGRSQNVTKKSAGKVTKENSKKVSLPLYALFSCQDLFINHELIHVCLLQTRKLQVLLHCQALSLSPRTTQLCLVRPFTNTIKFIPKPATTSSQEIEVNRYNHP
jgi:hypothetical protein